MLAIQQLRLGEDYTKLSPDHTVHASGGQECLTAPALVDLGAFSFSVTGFSFFEVFTVFDMGSGAHLRGTGAFRGDLCV